MNTTQVNKKITKLHKSGEIQKAIEYCQSVLTKDPTNADLNVRLGDLYMEWHLDVYQAKQYIDEAITQYQRALETYIDSGELYFKIGRAFYYKGELDRAINYFNLAIDNNFQKGESYFMIAQSFQRKDRYTDALRYVDKAIENRRFSTSRYHHLKHRLLKVLFFRDFKTSLQSTKEWILSVLTLPFDKKALEEFFKSFKTLAALPYLMEGFVQFKARNFEKAIEIYTAATDRIPGFIPLYILLGDIYRAIGRHEEAVIEYKMAIWLDSLNSPAYAALCQCYEEMGDYTSAISTYEKYISIHPYDAVLHSNLANLLYMKQDFDEAIKHYHTAITLNPNKNWTSVIAQTLGFVYQNAGKDPDAAIGAYQNAYLITPKDIDIYVNLGSAFYDKSDYDNALAVYRRALELDPDNSRIHCNLGYLHWGKGDLTEAIKEYELSIKFDPNYDIAYNNLGVIYLDDLGRVQKAIELFSKATECNPSYALAYYNLARSLAIKGEKIEAAKYYQVAMDINKITNEIDPNDIKDRLNGLFD